MEKLSEFPERFLRKFRKTPGVSAELLKSFSFPEKPLEKTVRTLLLLEKCGIFAVLHEMDAEHAACTMHGIES